MNEPLFLDHQRLTREGFLKIAAASRLSESPENWQKEIASEAFKQAPFLADYSVNIVIDKGEPQRGYAYGSIIVSNKTEAPEKEKANLPKITIPIIVRDRLLMPLDVFLDNKKVFPLTEWRVREKLFRTETFELSTRRPTDQGLVDTLYPPLRTNYGQGNMIGTGIAGMGGLGKFAGQSLHPAMHYTEDNGQKVLRHHLGDGVFAVVPAAQAQSYMKMVRETEAREGRAKKGEEKDAMGDCGGGSMGDYGMPKMASLFGLSKKSPPSPKKMTILATTPDGFDTKDYVFHEIPDRREGMEGSTHTLAIHRSIAPEFYSSGSNLREQLEAMKPYNDTKFHVFSRNAPEIKKTARVFGASVPGEISEASVPFDIRRRSYDNYLNEKAHEEKTPTGKAALIGTIPGALAGALIGGLGARSGKAALIGGAIGSGLGALTGAGMASADSHHIDKAKHLRAHPDDIDPALAQAIHHQTQLQRSSDYMTAERRHQQMRSAMDRPITVFAKSASLLEMIAPTVPESESRALLERLQGDEQLKLAANVNPAFAQRTADLIFTERVGVEKTASALVQSIKPTVVQIQKQASGNFLVKWANDQAFAPQEAQMGAGQVSDMVGSDRVVRMKPGEAVTVTTDPVQKKNLYDEKLEQVRDFGQFRVQNADTGEQLVGWVLPIIDFEMHPLPLYVFMSPGAYGVQDNIAGSRIGHDLNLPEAPPQGDGCFYYVSNERVTATPPLTIKATTTGADGQVSYHAEDLWHGEITLSLAPGLQAIAKVEENHYALPDTFKFLPLQNAVHLVKDPMEMAKIAEARDIRSTAVLRTTGAGEYSLDGAPFDSLSREDKQFLKTAQAEFLLVAAGCHPFRARELFKEAARYGQVKLAGLRQIVPLAQLHQQAIKQAAHVLSDFPYHLRKDLVKEAAVIPDGDTVDSILAMGFINPENVATFASYLPQIDETVSKLAEMLLYARLGLNQIPEGACERAIKAIEEVIEGLRLLQQSAQL